MKFDAFSSEFPEARLGEVYRLLEAAMMAAYNGELELRFTQRNHALLGEAEPVVLAQAYARYDWGNGWERRESGGEIWWSTSSGHQVRFIFVLTRNAAGWDEVDLSRVEIGADPSTYFYPRIREICADVGVDCIVTACGAWGGAQGGGAIVYRSSA